MNRAVQSSQDYVSAARTVKVRKWLALIQLVRSPSQPLFIDNDSREAYSAFLFKSHNEGDISMKVSRLLVIALMLFAFSAFDARAQNPGPTPTPRRDDRILIVPSDRIIVTPDDSTVLKSDRYKLLLASTITGKIRWRKEYGLPSIDGGRTPDKATNCTAIRVQATVQEGAPGSFGRAVNVGYIELQNEPTEEEFYYVCGYSITDRNNDLPRNRSIAVSAFLAFHEIARPSFRNQVRAGGL